MTDKKSEESAVAKTVSLNNILIRSVLFVSVTLIVFVGVYYSKDTVMEFYNNWGSDITIDRYQNSQDKLADMNFDEAIAYYDDRLSKTTEKEAETALKIRKAYALFSRSNEGDMDNAVLTLKSVIEDETQPDLFKSWALVGLLQFYYKSRSVEVLDELRKLTIFSSEIPTDDTAFLRYVAEVSNEFSPSVFGKIFMAAPLAAEIVKEGTTTERKTELAYEIQTLVEESSFFQNEEQWLNTPHDLMLLEHYRGLLLSAASVGGVDSGEANVHFQTAIEIAKTNKSPATDELVLYTYFYYAGHMLQHGNEEGAVAEIDALLSRATGLNESSPFVLFARVANSNPSSHSYSIFKLISDKHEGFKKYWSDNFSLNF